MDLHSDSSETSDQRLIFLVSAVGLFLELALIRWVSCEVRIFAYFKNMVLVACFLGFGTGCLLSHKQPQILRALLLLLLLCLVIQLPWQPLADYGPRRISRILSEMPGLMIFHSADTVASWQSFWGLAFAVAWTIVIFLVLAMIMVPFGQIIASAMSRLKDRPIRAYSINVAGSLTGILVYTLATSMELPPACWFVPVSLLFLYFPSVLPVRKEILAVTAALALTLLPNDTPKETTYWSPYQKLTVVDGNQVVVNNVNYQIIREQPLLAKDKTFPITRTVLPYLVRRPPGNVLIIGSGTGNDVAAALGAGAVTVTAVDIDPVIVDLGRTLHPQKPYDDPRVSVVIDDARHFLRTTSQMFDLIVFSHLDSHSVLSSFTNVRLDYYIYTVESLQDARRRLNPRGVLFLSFYSEQLYIPARLERNLKEAFGHDPVGLTTAERGGFTLIHFFSAEPEWMPNAENLSRATGLSLYRNSGGPVVPSTDTWPFLTLSEPHIPILVRLLSVIIIVLYALFIWRSRPPSEPFRARVFWLGAAFMLLEVHNVSRLALCFGTTWQVNAWVIGAILSVILVANWVCSRFVRKESGPSRWIVAGLFASLLAAYFAPLDVLGGSLATLLLTTPIFFAGILFADAFAASSTPSFALGWNILGAVVGGMAESLSYVFGIPSLILIASGFYGLAILSRRAPQ